MMSLEVLSIVGAIESGPQNLYVPINSWSYGIGKRCFDILIVLCLLPLVVPVGLFLALLIKLTSRGPVFYRHSRIGRNKQPFHLWKLRTMWHKSEEMLAPYLAIHPEAREEWTRHFKLANDPRVTPLGRVLRRTSLDELPQLINILRGEMSFVGPRPITLEETKRYGGGVGVMLSAYPGLTGLWQVCGRGQLEYEVRVALDVEYVATWTFWGDIALLLRTVTAVLFEEGAY